MSPPSRTVAVIGLGLIGGSVAIDLREQKWASKILGVDESNENAQKALELSLVDSICSLEDSLKAASVIVLAMPVTAIHQMLPKILDRLSPEATVTDMGSTKGQIAHAVIGHPKRKQLVLSHPMAGTENSGPTAALRGLFRGKTAVICDTDESGAENIKVIEDFYDALKMRKIYMKSDEHDMHAAFVSHLSHISSFILANTVLDIEKNDSSIFDMAGGGFESTVRLAKSSPGMWIPIFEQNQENILKALDAYIKRLQEFHQSLVQKKWNETQALLVKANGIRRVLNDISVKIAAKEGDQ